MNASAARKPLITANMVTFARLVPMPAVAWFFYGAHYWTAIIIGTAIGCTDFIDGYLARKHGPTVLGGLMDPIADKVFIAFAYLPFADPRLHFFPDWFLAPAWLIAAMFVRELVVTALRSSYKRRDMSMKTSYLGKVKTWTQMQGIGTMMMLILLADNRTAIIAVLATMAAAPLVAMVVFYAVKKKLWRGALIMSGITGALIPVYLSEGLPLLLVVTLCGIVALTWASGLDYLIGGLRQLRGRGDMDRFDSVRIIGAIALPFLLMAALNAHTASPWFLVTILSLELAVGGLDNLLAHHKAASAAGPWALRVLGTSVLIGAGLLLQHRGETSLAEYAVIAAVAVSLVGSAYEFWRGRSYYLDSDKREKRDPMLGAVGDQQSAT